MTRRAALALVLALVALPSPGLAQAPSSPSAVEPGDAPRSIPTPIRSAWPTPGYKQKPAATARVPYAPQYPFKKPDPAVLARHGAVACVSPLASQIGVDVLRRGGNSVDAAVAVALALAVVYPEAGNIGGGGFMMIRSGGGLVAALDYREVAPGKATPKMYLDQAGNVTPKSQIGHLAAGVPGTVAGLEAAHKRFGKRPWAELVAPAVKLARDGFVVNDYLAKSMHRAQDLLLRYDETRRVFMINDITPKAGMTLRQPDLARTLERIQRQGARGFYEGPTAEAIARDMAANGGLITRSDLAAYKPKWRDPVSFTYRGHRVYGMPPPSSGAVTLAQIMNILEAYDLKAMGWHSARHVHYMVEAERRAYADRNTYLGDPDFIKRMPIETLMSKPYAAKRRATIRDDKATPDEGRKPGLGEPEQTTHFSIVDRQGGCVSNTYTLNGNFGNGVVVPGTGVLLNNEMDDFAAKPGAPNMFGLVQGPRNAIAPRKRPLSSMTPAILLDPQGRLFMVVGAPGGSTIITTVMQVISNVIDFGFPLNWAIAAPRLHHQGQPDVLYHEPHGLDPITRTEIVRFGHQVEGRPPIGDAQGILRRPDGAWEAFADPRRAGEAFGY